MLAGKTFECVYILQNQLACTCTCIHVVYYVHVCTCVYMHTCDSWTRFVYILKLYHQFTLELDDIHEPFNSARDQTAATPLPGEATKRPARHSVSARTGCNVLHFHACTRPTQNNLYQPVMVFTLGVRDRRK